MVTTKAIRGRSRAGYVSPMEAAEERYSKARSGVQKARELLAAAEDAHRQAAEQYARELDGFIADPELPEQRRENLRWVRRHIEWAFHV